jgi:hypothetical protein
MARIFRRRLVGPFAAASCALLLCGCLSGSQVRPTPYQRFPITVDYDQSIEDLVAAGSYYRTYSEISSKNFPSEATGTRELQVALVQLGDNSSISKILSTQSSAGLRPATIRELLSFAVTYPEMLKHFTIAGLGSSRTYSVETYDHFGMGPNDVEVNITRQQFFPSIDSDPFGLALVLIQEDMIPSFDPGGFYGCFIAVE